MIIPSLTLGHSVDLHEKKRDEFCGGVFGKLLFRKLLSVCSRREASCYRQTVTTK